MRRVFFRECQNLVPPGIFISRKAGDGIKKLFWRLPRTSSVCNPGHLCSSFGHSILRVTTKYFLFVLARSPAGTHWAGSGTRHLHTGFHSRSRTVAFTLVEVMISLGVMVLF